MLTGYERAVKKHDISPLVGFEQYLSTAAAIEDNLVGKITANGIEIKSYATHFIDRVIGQVSEPHEGKRCGVLISDILDALQNPSKIGAVHKRNNDTRQAIFGKKAKVVISIDDNRLIQTNPRREKNDAKND